MSNVDKIINNSMKDIVCVNVFNVFFSFFMKFFGLLFLFNFFEMFVWY